MTGRGAITPEDVRDETADTVDDDTDTCIECGQPAGECTGDCLRSN